MGHPLYANHNTSSTILAHRVHLDIQYLEVVAGHTALISPGRECLLSVSHEHLVKRQAGQGTAMKARQLP